MTTKLIHTPFEQLLLGASRGTVVKSETSKSTISSVVFLPASIPAFTGHFPGQPVFPAVLQLTFVRLLCAEVTQKNLQNVSVGKTKFSGIIRPEEKIKVEIELAENEHEYEAKFKFVNGDKLASCGTVTYKATH